MSNRKIDMSDINNAVDFEGPPLSATVAQAVDESVDPSDWIVAHHPNQILQTRNHMLAGTLYALSMEHREAILLLVRHNARSSAFALWRPTYEAYMRGYWAENCATDQDFSNIKANNNQLPKLEQIVSRLEKFEPETEHARTKSAVWKTMSHFAHGGIQALARWMGPDGIGSNHPDEEAVSLLRMVNIYGVLACAGAARIAGPHGVEPSLFDAKLAEMNANTLAATKQVI